MGTLVTQLKESDAKNAEEVKVLEGKNVELLDQNNKIVEELKTFQIALTKAIVDKEKFKESYKLNFQEAKKLEEELITSRKENEGLEGRIKELEEANASNLERYKGTTSNCFYAFWKHNCEANFNYLFGRMRQTKIARCLARLVEEERAKIPASPRSPWPRTLKARKWKLGPLSTSQLLRTLIAS
ncbi:uncharacterized protein LOC133832347 [Humulus lupulus]|uniref:uncharacterized protein LOC133832347 n=1 Tax=Humulus lupulus TaxID=3486 RepID=UPI002B4127A6|nr:uncharacterized protein LOC133832347 [Humulus lupulus]